MASFVTVADAISAAVEIERRGREFYQRAARSAQSAQSARSGGTENAGEFFAFMAEEERRHEQVFADMLGRALETAVPSDGAEPEYLAYLRASLDAHNFFINGPEPGDDPYNTALAFEKDSIVYFTGLLALVPESEKPLLRRCIDEEKDHIRLIRQKRREAAVGPRSG